jgi:hypothetical protein
MDVWEETMEGPGLQNGIRDWGLRQQLQGSKWIKNQGTRWRLRLKIERALEEFNRKAFGLEFVMRATGMSSGLRKTRNWNLWRGHPLLSEKSRTGHFGGVSPLQNGGKTYQKHQRKNLSRMVGDTSGSTGTLAVSHSEPAALRTKQWVHSDNEHSEKRKEQLAGRRWKYSPPKGRKGDTPLGYSGQTALRREQCDMPMYCQRMVQ